jgi:site-specific DNA-methyltransferase (adenine-specific)/modification methylase
MSSLRSTKQFCRTRCRVAWNRQRAAGLQRSTVQLGALQVPCVQIGALITLYCGDGPTIAHALQHTGAVILDPPYGTKYDVTKTRRSKAPLQGMAAAQWEHAALGDESPFDPTPWLSYRQLMLWGANHYTLPAAKGWIVWDKQAGGTDLAWSNIPGSSFQHTQLWSGRIRAGEDNGAKTPKLHPWQKPIELMRKCVHRTTGCVLDAYMGSGTTGLACLEQGRPFVGIELDPYWFQKARVRLAAAAKQLQLFAPAAEAAD